MLQFLIFAVVLIFDQGCSSIVSCSDGEEGCKEKWEGAQLGQVAQTDQRIFHTTEYPAQYVYWGELPRREAYLGLGKGL